MYVELENCDCSSIFSVYPVEIPVNSCYYGSILQIPAAEFPNMSEIAQDMAVTANGGDCDACMVRVGIGKENRHFFEVS